MSVSKYIIMCGGNYQIWKEPRQLTKINNEPIVVRTIRLLREAGVEDIAISSNDSRFEGLGVPVLKSENNWTVIRPGVSTGGWYNGFYKTNNGFHGLHGLRHYKSQEIWDENGEYNPCNS